jgi:hypothetical protein
MDQGAQIYADQFEVGLSVGVFPVQKPIPRPVVAS